MAFFVIALATSIACSPSLKTLSIVKLFEWLDVGYLMDQSYQLASGGLMAVDPRSSWRRWRRNRWAPGGCHVWCVSCQSTREFSRWCLSLPFKGLWQGGPVVFHLFWGIQQTIPEKKQKQEHSFTSLPSSSPHHRPASPGLAYLRLEALGRRAAVQKLLEEVEVVRKSSEVP